jgi:hypothetical protein
MNTVGPIPTPTLRDLLNAHRDEIMAGFNCHQTGTIVSFDATKQTAQVQLNVQRTVYNKLQTTEAQPNTPVIINYPVLVDVPVFFLTGGTARITMPVAAGDTCLVLFNDRDLDPWFTTGTQAAPNTSRMHSLADGLALVGFRSQANKAENYSTTDIEIRHGDSLVSVKSDGYIEIIAPRTWIKGTAKNNRIQNLEDGGITLQSDKTAGASGVYLTEKVRIANTGGDLLTTLNLVITALTALNSKTGPSAATQITAAQTAITNLLN